MLKVQEEINECFIIIETKIIPLLFGHLNDLTEHISNELIKNKILILNQLQHLFEDEKNRLKSEIPLLTNDDIEIILHIKKDIEKLLYYLKQSQDHNEVSKEFETEIQFLYLEYQTLMNEFENLKDRLNKKKSNKLIDNKFAHLLYTTINLCNNSQIISSICNTEGRLVFEKLFVLVNKKNHVFEEYVAIIFVEGLFKLDFINQLNKDDLILVCKKMIFYFEILQNKYQAYNLKCFFSELIFKGFLFNNLKLTLNLENIIEILDTFITLLIVQKKEQEAFVYIKNLINLPSKEEFQIIDSLNIKSRLNLSGFCSNLESTTEEILLSEKDLILIKHKNLILGHIKNLGEKTFLSYVNIKDSKGNILLVKGLVYSISKSFQNRLFTKKIKIENNQILAIQINSFNLSPLRLIKSNNFSLIDLFLQSLNEEDITEMQLKPSFIKKFFSKN